MYNIGVNKTVEIVEMGKIYAYFYKGRLCIGEAVKNPAERPGYNWAMKNVYTGKIEYPYRMDIIVPNSEYKEVVPEIGYR